MLNVDNNKSNTIILTLTESIYDYSITGTTTGYTMSLINETTNETFSGITLNDISLYKERYNEFNIILTGLTSIDYTQTKIYLKDEGFYKYKVYYNVDSNIELIEEGFMKVNCNSEIISSLKYTDNDDKSWFSYKN